MNKNKPLKRIGGSFHLGNNRKLITDLHDTNEELKELSKINTRTFLIEKKNKFSFLTNEKFVEVDKSNLMKGEIDKNLRLEIQDKLISQLEDEQNEKNLEIDKTII